MIQQATEYLQSKVSEDGLKSGNFPLFLESQLNTWARDFLQKKSCQCGLCFDSKSSPFSIATLRHFKRELNFLSVKEREMYILTLLQEARQPSLLQLVRPRGKDNKRVRLTLNYHVYPFGRVCRSVFRCLFDISDTKLRNLLRHLQRYNFPHSRCHGNTEHIPKHTLPVKERTYVEDWIKDFANRIGEPNWRTITADSDLHLIFLPACYTISMLYNLCLKGIRHHIEHSFSKSLFYSIFRSEPCKHIRINSPRSDMCDTCDLLKSTLISIAHKHKEGEEVPLPPTELIDHLSLAHAAREDYRADQKKAHKKEISHFSFDYSQNLALPQKADQPGSFYFFSLRNIYLFGITDESCNHQMNYLIDESQCAKGSNEVISMISHFLSSLPKEKRAHIIFNADNCVGQNKNNTMIKFFLWQCLIGNSKTIEVKFMIKGHTHFGPDSHFGYIKKRYRRSDVFSVEDLKTIIQASSTTNKATILDHANFFDFKAGLKPYFKDLQGITNYHYFLFKDSLPGIVSVKKHLNDPWTEHHLTKKTVNISDLRTNNSFKPSLLVAPGIALEKQIDLYKKVRKYVPDEFKDVLCPKPPDYTADCTCTRSPNKSKKADTPAVPTSKSKRRKASKGELKLLNELYSKTPYPNRHVLIDIADEMNWTIDRVKIWFNNRRYKSKTIGG